MRLVRRSLKVLALGFGYALMAVVAIGAPLSQFDPTSSAQFRSIITDPSGNGPLTFCQLGTGPNDCVQLNSSGQLPALDGSNLVNLNASAINGLVTAGSSQATTPTIVSKTSGYVVLPTDTGTHFDNYGATGLVTLTLPPASAGLNYCFAVAAAQTVMLVPSPTDTLVVAGASTSAGDAVTANSIGTSLCLTANQNGQWISTAAAGSWSAWNPASIPNLLYAWDFTKGVTASGGTVSAVAGAWGTSTSLVQGTGANQPTLATGMGSRNENLLSYSSATPSYTTFTDTGVQTAMTSVTVMAPRCASGVTNGVWSRGSSNTSFQTISGTCQFLVRPVSAASSATVAPPIGISGNLQTLGLVYNTSNGGQVTPYVDGIAGTAVTSIGTGGMDFAGFGAQGLTSTSACNCYAAVAILYSRDLTASEMTQLSAYLHVRRGLNAYVSTSGNDSSQTFWNQSTPLLTPTTAVALPWHGGETIALKGGDVFHSSARLLPYTSVPSNRTVTLNGNQWGTTSKPAQLRFSVAPTCTLVTGTIYNCGAQAAPAAGTSGGAPTNFIYYVPNGVYTFGGSITGYEITNVVRLPQNTSTPTTPGVNEWGSDGTNIYVNIGGVVNPGDIEIPLAPSGFIVAGIYNNLANNWTYSYFDIAFANATGLQNRGSLNINLIGVRAFFNALDGLDAAYGTLNDGTTLNSTLTVAAWNGSGLVPGTGGPGDGYSCHESTICNYLQVIAAQNDKSQIDNLTGTTTVIDRSLLYGNSPIWFDPSSSYACGSYTVKNSLIYVPAGLDSYTPIGIRHNANGASGTCLLTALNNTLFSFSRNANYVGFSQGRTSSNIVARNNAIYGFNVGVQAISGGTGVFTADHNLLFNNASNYSVISAGTGDVTLNPFFAAAPWNLRIMAGSPAQTAGTSVGTTIDYVGAPRQTPPSIGAYQ